MDSSDKNTLNYFTKLIMFSHNLLQRRDKITAVYNWSSQVLKDFSFLVFIKCFFIYNCFFNSIWRYNCYTFIVSQLWRYNCYTFIVSQLHRKLWRYDCYTFIVSSWLIIAKLNIKYLSCAMSDPIQFNDVQFPVLVKDWI